MVIILSGSRKKSKFVYVAVIQSLNDNSFTANELKSINTTKQTYKIQANGLFKVDIIYFLKMPTIIKTNNYIFSLPHMRSEF